jgi:hypothetical protein
MTFFAVKLESFSPKIKGKICPKSFRAKSNWWSPIHLKIFYNFLAGGDRRPDDAADLHPDPDDADG